MGTPPAEHEVDADLARRLLQDQHPDLAELPMTRVDSGFDNLVVRLGDDLAVRLPRREVAVGLAEHEHRWLPVIAERLPLPVPVPVRLGTPGLGYPWPWAVVRWVPGTSAETAPVRDGAIRGEPRSLADFLRRPAPNRRRTDAPARTRSVGIPLPEPPRPHTGDGPSSCADRADRTGPRRRWPPTLGARGHGDLGGPRNPVWLHGDLHARHVLTVRRPGQRGHRLRRHDLRRPGHRPRRRMDAAAPAPPRPVPYKPTAPDDDTWERSPGLGHRVRRHPCSRSASTTATSRADSIAEATLRRALEPVLTPSG
jgi:hypothetical protein